MPIELRKGRNGKLRSMWYGKYEVAGKRFTVNLGVKVAGKPPATLSLRDEGDSTFERSRALAQAKFDQIVDEVRRRKGVAHLVERIYEIKSGEQFQSVKLVDLPDAWANIPRRRSLAQNYVFQCRSTLVRFARFIREHNPRAEEMVHVNRGSALAFMNAEADRGVASNTWNGTLKLLRAAFKYLMPAGSVNPFYSIPTREVEVISRRPFNPEDLRVIVNAARDDNFVRPIIITAICTAMRKGDCCLLKPKDVDLARRFVTVKTSKTGQMVSIPIFPLLYDELCQVPLSGVYVFPEQAEMYKSNPGGITWRVRKVFAAAGFKDKDQAAEGEQAGDKCRGQIHVDRGEGLRRASVLDFHSFRVTWVTLALTAGVPLELVQKVTGHKTTEVVLKHYFQPGREEFRQALQSAMPRLLTNDQKTPKEEMRTIIERVTAATLERDKSRLLELLTAI